MPTPRLACPNCGWLDWDRAPALRDTLAWARTQRRLTARDVADHFDTSIQNASNRCVALMELGFLRNLGSVAHPIGGREIVYAPEPTPTSP